MAEINLPIKVSILNLQLIVLEMQSKLSNLKVGSSGFKMMQNDIRKLLAEIDRLLGQASKPFINERLFDSASRSVEKIEDRINLLLIDMSRLKFGDLELNSNLQHLLDEFNNRIKEIQTSLTQLKLLAKADFLASDMGKIWGELNPTAVTKSLDLITRSIESLVTSLLKKIKELENNLNDYQRVMNMGTAAEKFANAKNPLSREGMGADFFKFFNEDKNGKLSFKAGQKPLFEEWLELNLNIDPGVAHRLVQNSANLVKQELLDTQSDIRKSLSKSVTLGLKAKVDYNDKNTLLAQQNNELALKILMLRAAAEANDRMASSDTNLRASLTSVTADFNKWKDSVASAALSSNMYTDSARKIKAECLQLHSTLATSTAEFMKQLRVLNNFNSIKMAIVNFMGFRQVLNLVKRGVQDALNHIKELDTVMNRISIVTNMSTGDLWKQVDSYSDMAQKYGVSIKGAYEVSQIYYQQGLQTKDVLTLTNETLKLAKISGLDYALTTDYMTTALRGFKMEMSEASTVVDVYSNLAAHTAVTLEELAVAMSKTASSMESVGSSFEESSAMIATMVAVTRESATNIGSALKSIAARYGEMKKDPMTLVDSEGEALAFNKVDAALQSVGISMKTTDGLFRNFTDVIIELSEKWNTLESTQLRYIATQFAGNRQQSRFLALVSNADLLKSNLNYAENSEDVGTILALKALDSIEAKTEKVRVAYQLMYTTIGAEDMWKSFLDGAKNVMNTLNILPKLFGKLPVGAIAMVADFVKVIKDIGLRALGGVSSLWDKLLPTEDAKAKGEAVGQAFSLSIADAIKKAEAILKEAGKLAVTKVGEGSKEGLNDANNPAKPATDKLRAEVATPVLKIGTEAAELSLHLANAAISTGQIADNLLRAAEAANEHALAMKDISISAETQNQLLSSSGFSEAFLKELSVAGIDYSNITEETQNILLKIIASVASSSDQIRDAFKLVGDDAIVGYVSGLLLGQGMSQEAAGQVGKASVSGIRTAIQSSSPSKATMKIGTDFVEGYVLGIAALGDKAIASGKGVGQKTLDGLNGALNEKSFEKLKTGLLEGIDLALAGAQPENMSDVDWRILLMSLAEERKAIANTTFEQFLGGAGEAVDIFNTFARQMEEKRGDVSAYLAAKQEIWNKYPKAGMRDEINSISYPMIMSADPEAKGALGAVTRTYRKTNELWNRSTHAAADASTFNNILPNINDTRQEDRIGARRVVRNLARALREGEFDTGLGLDSQRINRIFDEAYRIKLEEQEKLKKETDEAYKQSEKLLAEADKARVDTINNPLWDADKAKRLTEEKEGLAEFMADKDITIPMKVSVLDGAETTITDDILEIKNKVQNEAEEQPVTMSVSSEATENIELTTDAIKELGLTTEQQITKWERLKEILQLIKSGVDSEGVQVNIDDLKKERNSLANELGTSWNIGSGTIDSRIAELKSEPAVIGDLTQKIEQETTAIQLHTEALEEDNLAKKLSSEISDEFAAFNKEQKLFAEANEWFSTVTGGKLVPLITALGEIHYTSAEHEASLAPYMQEIEIYKLKMLDALLEFANALILAPSVTGAEEVGQQSGLLIANGLLEVMNTNPPQVNEVQGGEAAAKPAALAINETLQSEIKPPELSNTLFNVYDQNGVQLTVESIVAILEKIGTVSEEQKAKLLDLFNTEGKLGEFIEEYNKITGANGDAQKGTFVAPTGAAASVYNMPMVGMGGLPAMREGADVTMSFALPLIDTSALVAQIQALIDKLVEMGALAKEKGAELKAGFENATPELLTSGIQALTAALHTAGDAGEQASSKLSKINLGTIGSAIRMLASLTGISNELKGVITLVGGAITLLGVKILLVDKASKTAAKTNPWMAIAMGIMAVWNGLSMIIETPAERLERLKKEAEELNNTAKQLKAESKELENSKKKIEELELKRYDSAEAAQEYLNAVDDLTDKFPNLIKGFDEAGNAILDANKMEELLTSAREKSADATYKAAAADLEVLKAKLKENIKTAALAGTALETYDPTTGKMLGVLGSAYVLSGKKAISEKIPQWMNNIWDPNLDSNQNLSSSIQNGAWKDPQLAVNNWFRYATTLDEEQIFGTYAEQTAINKLLNEDLQSAYIKEGETVVGLDYNKAIELLENMKDRSVEALNMLDFLKEFVGISSNLDTAKLNNNSSTYFKNLDNVDARVKERIDSGELENDDDITILNDAIKLYNEVAQNPNSSAEEIADAYNYMKFVLDELKTNVPYLADWIDNLDIGKVGDAVKDLMGTDDEILAAQLRMINSWFDTRYTVLHFIKDSSGLKSVINDSVMKKFTAEAKPGQTLKSWLEKDGYNYTDELVSQADTFWIKLSDDNQELFTKMLGDTKHYSLKDFALFGITEGSPLYDILKSYYDDIEKGINERITAKLELTDIRKLFEKDTESEQLFKESKLKINTVSEERYFNTVLNKYQDLMENGYTDLAHLYAEAMLGENGLLNLILGLSASSRAKVLDLIGTNGINTKEGIDKTIDSIKGDETIPDDLKQIIINNLTSTKDLIISNIGLSLQTAVDNYLDSWKSASKTFSKLTSGIDITDVNSIINSEAGKDMELTLDNFKMNGDKLVLSANDAEKYIETYFAKEKTKLDGYRTDLINTVGKWGKLDDSGKLTATLHKDSLINESGARQIESIIGTGNLKEYAEYDEKAKVYKIKEGRATDLNKALEEGYTNAQNLLDSYDNYLQWSKEQVIKLTLWAKGNFESLNKIYEGFENTDLSKYTGTFEEKVLKRLKDLASGAERMTEEERSSPDILNAMKLVLTATSKYINDLITKDIKTLYSEDYIDTGRGKDIIEKEMSNALIMTAKLFAQWIAGLAEQAGLTIQEQNDAFVKAWDKMHAKDTLDGFKDVLFLDNKYFTATTNQLKTFADTYELSINDLIKNGWAVYNEELDQWTIDYASIDLEHEELDFSSIRGFLETVNDSVNNFFDRIKKLIKNGIDGTLSNVDALELLQWALDHGLDPLSFVETADGLLLTADSMAVVYDRMKKINSLLAKSLLPSIKASNNNYKSLAGTLREVAEFEKRTVSTNPAIAEAKKQAEELYGAGGGTVPLDFELRPHIEEDGFIKTVESTSAGIDGVEVLVTPILPDGSEMSKEWVWDYAEKFARGEIKLNTKLVGEDGKELKYTFKDIYMGTFDSAEAADAAAKAYHNYHESIVNANKALKNLNATQKAQSNLLRDLVREHLVTADSMNFMSTSLPEGMLAVVNAWENSAKGMKVLDQAEKDGYIGVQDFYNIVTTASSLMEAAGKDFKVGTQTAADLLYAAGDNLKIVDGKLTVDISNTGMNIVGSVGDLKNNLAEGIHELAKAQIEMLDAEILVLEVLAAMEEIGDVDVNGNGIGFEIDDMFETLELPNGAIVRKFNAGMEDYLTNLELYAWTHDNVLQALQRIKLGNYTMWELVQSKDWAKWQAAGFTEESLSQFLQTLTTMDWDTDNILQLVADVLSGLSIGVLVKLDHGLYVFTLTGEQYTFDWDDKEAMANAETALDKWWAEDLRPTKEKIEDLVLLHLTGKDKEGRELTAEEKWKVHMTLALASGEITFEDAGNGEVIAYYKTQKFLGPKEKVIEDIGLAMGYEDEGYTFEYDAESGVKGKVKIGRSEIIIDDTGTERVYQVGERTFSTMEEAKGYLASLGQASASDAGQFFTFTNDQNEKETWAIYTDAETNLTYSVKLGDSPEYWYNGEKFDTYEAFMGYLLFVSKGASGTFEEHLEGEPYVVTFASGLRMEYRLGENGWETVYFIGNSLFKNEEEATKYLEATLKPGAVISEDQLTVSYSFMGYHVEARFNADTLTVDYEMTLPDGGTITAPNEASLKAAVYAHLLPEGGEVTEGVEGINYTFVSNGTTVTVQNGEVTVKNDNLSEEEKLQIEKETKEKLEKQFTENPPEAHINATATTADVTVAEGAQVKLVNEALKLNPDLDKISGTVSEVELTATDINVDSVGALIVLKILEYLTSHPLTPSITNPNVNDGSGGVDTSTILTIATILSTISSRPFTEILNALSNINADSIKAILKAEESIEHSNVDAIKTAQDQITTSKIDSVQLKLNNLSAKIKTKVEGGHASGTLGVKVNVSSAKGNMGAFAKGNVALASGTRTLMGELGPEMVVSNGRYFLVGLNGAEFVNLEKDAIVFNHQLTERLLSLGGIGSRGVPFTNETNAISYAKGNVSGPAKAGAKVEKYGWNNYFGPRDKNFTIGEISVVDSTTETTAKAKGNIGKALVSGIAMASAKSALNALKLLRNMWKSLLGAGVRDLSGIGGSGGGGGGGGSENPEKQAAFIKELEKWYNWLLRIAELETKINYEEALRNKITSLAFKSGKAYYNSLRKTLDYLELELDVTKDLMVSQLKYFEERRAALNKQSAFSALYTFDEDGQLVYSNQKKQYKDQNGKNFSKTMTGFEFLSELNSRNSVTGQAKYTAKLQYDILVKNGFGNYMKYDASGNAIFTKENQIDEKNAKKGYKDEAYTTALQAFWDKIDSDKEEMQSLHDSVNEYSEKIFELLLQQNELLREMLDNLIDLENDILKAIEDSRQKNIDKLEDLKNAYQDASQEMISGLNNSLKNEREQYSKNQEEADLLKLRRRLALLQRSGGSASEIASLLKQIQSKSQDMYFSELLRQIDAIQEASDKQIEKMDQLIDILTKTLEYEKENGLLWEEVYEIMDKTPEEIRQYLTENTTDFLSKSQLAKSRDADDWLFKAEQWKEFLSDLYEGTDNVAKILLTLSRENGVENDLADSFEEEMKTEFGDTWNKLSSKDRAAARQKFIDTYKATGDYAAAVSAGRNSRSYDKEDELHYGMKAGAEWNTKKETLTSNSRYGESWNNIDSELQNELEAATRSGNAAAIQAVENKIAESGDAFEKSERELAQFIVENKDGRNVISKVAAGTQNAMTYEKAHQAQASLDFELGLELELISKYGSTYELLDATRKSKIKNDYINNYVNYGKDKADSDLSILDSHLGQLGTEEERANETGWKTTYNAESNLTEVTKVADGEEGRSLEEMYESAELENLQRALAWDSFKLQFGSSWNYLDNNSKNKLKQIFDQAYNNSTKEDRAADASSVLKNSSDYKTAYTNYLGTAAERDNKKKIWATYKNGNVWIVRKARKSTKTKTNFATAEKTANNNNKLYNQYVKDKAAGKKPKAPKYNNTYAYDIGGMVESTGTALLHAKEAVLTSLQADILRNDILGSNKNSLVNLLLDFRKAYNNIGNPGIAAEPTIIIQNASVNMNIDLIANDYDARRAGEQALTEMLRIARKNGAASTLRR